MAENKMEIVNGVRYKPRDAEQIRNAIEDDAAATERKTSTRKRKDKATVITEESADTPAEETTK